ncbi:hypothetical protein CRG98_019004 [Punica granatum]|uniref:Zinc knuckle CX2CX4HX4C domain-containing protein n=1 Tax=Punica granatum TaxID=22663 RepID=A0A2I0JW32_PUNGR|nr:hypothetical protein CRG98_019004 [Punica granatum]
MPIQYHCEPMLKRIGTALGQHLRTYKNTRTTTQGKFARLCVEIDLQKPLKPEIEINGRSFPIEYEGLHLIGFHCERFGHRKENCSELKWVGDGVCPGDANQMESVEGDEAAKESAPAVTGDAETGEAKATFGPWMIVQGMGRKSRAQAGQGEHSMAHNSEPAENDHRGGSRFEILGREIAENRWKEISGNTRKEDHGTDKLLLFNAVREADKKKRAPIRGNDMRKMGRGAGVFVVDLGPFPITDLGGRDMEAFTEETSLEGTHDQSLDTSLVEIASETNPMVQDEQLDVQRCLRGH